MRGTIPAGASQVIPVASDVAFQHLEAVLETAGQLQMKIENVNEEVLEFGEEVTEWAAGDNSPIAPGTLLVVVENTGTDEAAFELWEVLTESR